MKVKVRDMVNHPDHYTDHPTGIECIDIIEHMPFNRGAAIKYIWRAGKKEDIVEDLKKARWFIEREIARVEAQKSGRQVQCTPWREPSGSVEVLSPEREGSDSTGMDRVRRLVRKAEQF